jgi:superfamily II DNA or RNA helicase
MLMLPTGGGKTVMGAHIVAYKSREGKVSAFPVPRLSLINQTVERFEQYGLNSIGVIQGNHVRTNPNAALQVCSIQTLAARRRDARRPLDNLGLVIVDEAHERHDEIYRMKDWPDVVFVGLSATPWSRGLGLHWDDLIIVSTTQELINQKFLCDFIAYAPSTPDLDKVKTVAGEYQRDQLAAVMDDAILVADIVKTWLQRGENRPTFVFCVEVSHSKHVAERFLEAGVSAEHMDAETPLFERDEIFARFRSGETKIICSVGVLTTGVDEDVRCIVSARPTKSEILWVQQIGRGLRRAEGKDHLLILDHAGNHQRLGKVTDIFHDKLDDGKRGPDPRSDEEREAAAGSAPLPKLCPECSAVVSKQDAKCPQCGHAFHHWTEVQTRDGELVLLGEKGGRNGATFEEKRQFYREALWYTRERGNSDGRAFHIYQGRFGKREKPPWHWRDGELPQASLATINQIKRQTIAWRKGRAA